MNGRRRLLPVALLVALACHAAPAAGAGSGQGSVCDPDLVVEHASATAYRMRGDRCEGAHSLKISADTKLMIASLSTGIDFSADSAASLEVAWPAPPGSGPVNLRSRSLGSIRRGLFYRMDAVVPAGRSRFEWPVEVLAALRLGPADVGAVAWTTVEVPEGEPRTVYLPLRIGQPGTGPAPAVYRLLLVPAERLDEVFLTVSPLTAEGVAAAPLIAGRALELGYYPPDQATAIEIPVPAAPGLYRVDLAANLYRDPEKTVSTSIWLYHADGSR